MSDVNGPISRRRALALGGGIAGGLVIASSPLRGVPSRAFAASARNDKHLPVQQIEAIMGTTGMVMNSVLTIELDRNDLSVTGPGGIPFKPSFEVNSQFYFQPLDDGRAILNAEMALLASETNPVIDKLFAGGLFFQAFHQHFFDLTPQIWHIHFRGIGDPLQLAQAAINAVHATATPLPQTQPSNPTTPLDQDSLAHILGGTAMVGGDGVVTVSIPRADTIHLAGVAVKPELGVSVTVAFEPLDAMGQTAACAPDLALIATEINPTLAVMRAQGFDVHCLYNQETDEKPQLYFAHNLATGAPIDLAEKLARALDYMNLKRMIK